MIEEVMEEEKPNQREKISLRYADARKFIPEEVPYNRIQEYIMKVLEDHYKRLKHRSDRDSR
jgi:ParB family chromosome partitioning protein